MKMPRLSFIVALLIVGIVGATIYFDVDFVPVSIEGSWSEDALRNPFLAAGRLLERHGHPVRNLPAYATAPSGPGLLFLNQPGSSLQPKQVKELLAWVKAGNELLLEAPDQARHKIAEPLTDFLGVYRYHPKRKPAPKKIASAAAPAGLAPADSSADADQAKPDIPWLHLAPGDGGLQTSFTSYYSLRDDQDLAEQALWDRNGVHVLRYAVGKGHITVLSDNLLFDNENIGDNDNAALWLYLTDMPNKDKVWIVFSGHYPSLFHLLWQYGQPAILSLLVLVAAWLWWSSRRFGPLLPGIATPRRQLSEHLRACGRYLWYAGQQPRLYNAMRVSLRRRMMMRHPHWRPLSNNDLVSALAEFTGLEPAQLRRALIEKPTADLARFLNDVRVMNHVRKML